MSLHHRGEFQELSYEYKILAKQPYGLSFRTTSFQISPNLKWQFEVSFTDPSGGKISYDDFLSYAYSEIQITLIHLSGFVPATMQWSGTISINRVPCLMDISNIDFRLKYDELMRERLFIFTKKSHSIGRNTSNIYLRFKSFVWTTPSSEEPRPEVQQLEALSQHLMEQDKVLNDYKQMYLDSKMTDVAFKFGKKKLKAHRCVLSARSAAFQKLFENDASSKNQIFTVQCNYQEFDKFLQYLYTGQTDDIQQKDAQSLCSIAEDYNVYDLREFCVKKMSSALTMENALVLLEYSHLNKDKKVKRLVKAYIRDNFNAFVCKRYWASILIKYPELAHEISQM